MDAAFFQFEATPVFLLAGDAVLFISMKAHYETQIESILILARSGIILFILARGM